MILLTDEETRNAIKKYCDEQEIELPEYLPALEYHFIAQAQLKKVLAEAKVEDMSWKFRRALLEETQ